MHLGFRLILYLFNSLIPTVQNEQYSYDVLLVVILLYV